jgi:hypothetical protein
MNIHVFGTRGQIRAENLGMADISLTLTPIGARGPRGPDPWEDPVQVLPAATGAVEIDYREGKHVRMTLAGNVVLSVAHWPAGPSIARLTLRIINPAAHEITWPVGVTWPSGLPPIATPNGRDIFLLATDDGGATVDGLIAGLDFK